MSSPENDLLVIERWMAEVLAAMAPTARRKLFGSIGRELRSRTRRRMSAQTGPDGERWQPRARDAGKKVREQAKMMVKLRDDRRLLLTSSPDGTELGWVGAAARIAAVHHGGELDTVDPDSSKRVRYPMRRLIGLPQGDLDYIRQRLLEHLAPHPA